MIVPFASGARVRARVSVVLYKTPPEMIADLVGCLQASEERVLLSFIDNSPDDSAHALVPQAAEYVHTGRNLGYGAAHNISIRRSIEAGVPYHLVLNPDVRFGPRVLGSMLDRMDREVVIGQMMPRIVNSEGTMQHLCKKLPTPFNLILRRFVPDFIARSTRNKYELRHFSYNAELVVPNLSGCFMLFRCAALARVGLFDERFFMYAEDLDITRRMNASFKTLYFPGAQITHLHKRESYKSLRLLWIHLRSIVQYFNKYGWFFDRDRRAVNAVLLSEVKNVGQH